MHWSVAHEWNDVLLGPDGLPLDAWLAEGAATVVKSGAHRTVYRVDLPGRSFFVKHDHGRGIVRSIRRLFRATASRREWRKAIEVARRGVLTVTPVALGERRRNVAAADSFLVTAAIPGALSFSEFVRRRAEDGAPAAAAMRRMLTVRLAQLAAKAHRAGVDHNDFHPGNVLVQSTEGAANDVRLYLIDLPGVRLSGPLNWRRSRASLAMLTAEWLDRSTATQRLRFWRAYLAERPDLCIDERRAMEECWRATHEYVHRLLERLDKRPLRTNREFRTMRRGSVVVHALATIDRSELERWIAAPRPIPSSIGDATVDAVHFSTSHFSVRSHGPAAERWRQSYRLLARGIATLRPLAVMEERGLIGRRRGVMLVLHAHGLVPLSTYGEDLARLQPSRRRQLVGSLARLAARIHRWRMDHNTWSPESLGVIERAADVDALVIDVAAVQSAPRQSEHDRMASLARLASALLQSAKFTRSDAARFLVAYRRGVPDAPRDWKPIYREIAQRLARLREDRYRR